MSWSEAAAIRKPRALGVSPFCFLFIAWILAFSSADAGELHEMFIEQLAATPRTSFVTGLVMIDEQVDLAAVDHHIVENQLFSRANRHRYVIQTAQELARRTQAPVLAQLANWKLQGRVASYRSYWVTNMVSVTALPEVFDALAARPDVGIVYMNEPVPVRMGEDDTGEDAESGEPQGFVLPHNLICVNVEPAWNLGFQGQGRLVALFDSGADGNHPAFASRWRGTEPGVNWWEAWKDPYTGTTFPYDSRTHGTHVLGIMVGETPLGAAVGVAPEARWIAAGATIQFDAEKIIDCYEWAVDPDGDPETIDDVPDVINNSWGTTGDCQTTFWNAIDLVEAAGIVNTIAVDNRGPFAMSVNSPESRAESPTVNFSVGNVNSTMAGYPIYPTSGRGPSPCDSVSIKPELTAPGTSISSTVPGGGYDLKTGASHATPHTSGAVAILRQVDPDLSVEDIKLILMSTSVDKGTAGEDNSYGWGILNIGAAVDTALARLPRIPPSNLTAVAHGDTVSLSWERPSYIHVNNPFLHYRVFRAEGSDPFPNEPIAEVADNSAVIPFDDSPVPFADLRWRVTAQYQRSESAPSNEVAVTEQTWMNAPQSLTAEAHGDSVMLSWNRPEPVHPDNPITLYRVYSASDSEAYGDPLAEIVDPVETVGFVDPNVSFGDLRYVVTALYAAAESDSSNEASISASVWLTPPANLTTAVHADTVQLSWNRPGPIHPDNDLLLYRIYRSAWDEPFGTPLDEISDSLTSYTDSGVPLDSLRYSVTAVYVTQESDPSDHSTVDKNIWFTPPQTLSGEEEAGDVHLEWARPGPIHPANDLLLYRLYRALDGQPFGAPLDEVTDSMQVVLHDDLDVPPGTYDYAVRALYFERESDFSNTIQVTVADPAGVDDLGSVTELMLRVQPSPFHDETAVQFAAVGTAPISLTVFDVSGSRVRELFRSSGGRVEERLILWDGTDGNGNPVGTGTYFIRLLEGSRAITRRVVLIK